MSTVISPRFSVLGGVVLLIVACGGSRASDGGAAMTPARASTDPRGELTNAMTAMLAATSYRSRMVSSSSSGITGTTVLEFAAPDRFHLTRDTARPGRLPSRQETIIVGDATWTRSGDAPWQPFPLNVGELIRQFRNPKVVEDLANATDVQSMGADVLDGSPMLVYQYTLNALEGNGFKSTAKTWVAVTDHLPRKTESESDMTLGGQHVKTKTVVTYYDYGANVKIERPI